MTPESQKCHSSTRLFPLLPELIQFKFFYVVEGIGFRLSVGFVCLSGQILLPQYLMNGLSSLQETYRDYSLAPIDDLIRFYRSKVKVTTGCQGGRGIYVDAEAWNTIYSESKKTGPLRHYGKAASKKHRCQ